MGGLAALDLAIHHPDQVDSLVLAAAAVQLASPLAPGKPLNFLAPLLKRVLKKWNFPPIYADPSLAQYNTNYLWAPMDAVFTLLDFSRAIRKQLGAVKTPTLILQSRKDTTVAPESVDIIYNEISTPAAQKRIVWFEKSEHEMFRDCERAAIIEVITNYVQERVRSASLSL
jgi:carboxylesterase